MGVELINDPSVEADAEMISLVVRALRSTGLERFQIAIGDVEYFKGLCEEAGLDEDTELDLRALMDGVKSGRSTSVFPSLSKNL